VRHQLKDHVATTVKRCRMVLRTTNALRAKSVKLRNVAVLVVRTCAISLRRFRADSSIWTSAQWRL
jgi:hypothetical protein